MQMTTDSNLPSDPDGVPDQELSPGVVLNNGQFKITKFLASGGFGMTYLAKDSLDRDVVVKECFPSALCHRRNRMVVPTSSSAMEQFGSVVSLFVREAKAMSKLVHPNIVGVHQIFEDNDTAYMALDFIDGYDLLDIIEEKSLEVSPERVIFWLRKLLTAIEFVHEHDVLHRDISPDNILVDRDDNPVLIDFGAAREHATKASRALTTLRVVKDGYSPQEFYVQGSTQNRSSDLYALGATFYHLMDGEAPPNSQVRLAAVAEGRDDPYRPLLGRIEGFSDTFLNSIDMSLKVLPADRIQNASDWIEMIDASGPLVEPEPLDFDFDAIRDEVKRIAVEFEDIPAEEPVLEVVEPDPVEPEPEPEEAFEVELTVPVDRRMSGARIAAASFATVVVMSGAIYFGGFFQAERMAALAILTVENSEPQTIDYLVETVVAEGQEP